MDENDAMEGPSERGFDENESCESHENNAIEAEKRLEIRDAERQRLMAIVGLMPTMLGAETAKAYSRSDGLDLVALQKELSVQVSQVLNSNDFSRCEATLLVQIHVLNLIFNTCMQRALEQELFKGVDIFMKQGLKAQAQCRQSIEALHLLRNPTPSVFKQTNIANGPQQVNNGVNSDVQNELSTEPSCEGLEALEQRDWPDLPGGQATVSSEQQETRILYNGIHG